MVDSSTEGYSDRAPPKPRLFSVIPSRPEVPDVPRSEPVVLALLVAEALREAKLGNAVLEMRASPASWVSFLVELDSALREDSRGN